MKRSFPESWLISSTAVAKRRARPPLSLGCCARQERWLSVRGGCTADRGLSPLLPEGLQQAWRFGVIGCDSAGRPISPRPQRPCREELAGARPGSSPGLSKAGSKSKGHCHWGKGSLSRTSQGTLTVSTGHRGERKQSLATLIPSR